MSWLGASDDFFDPVNCAIFRIRRCIYGRGPTFLMDGYVPLSAGG